MTPDDETDEREDAAIARAFDMAGADALNLSNAEDPLVDEYREVLGHLPTPDIALGPELEERTVAAALARRPATVPSLDSERARRRSRTRLAILGVTAAAAAVVVAFLLVGGSSSTGVPTGEIELSTSQAADVEAILREPDVRVGTFSGSTGSNSAGKVALSSAGPGNVYGLTVSEPVTIGLVSEKGSSSLPPATPVDGVIGFVVDNPDRVTAITLSQNGREIAAATLP